MYSSTYMHVKILQKKVDFVNNVGSANVALLV